MSNAYWTDENFIKSVQQSKTISEVLQYFGLPINQGHYNRSFHKTVKKLNLDISHLKSNNLKNFIKIPLNELLVHGIFRSTTSLKERLIKESLLINYCYNCNMQPIWDNKELKMHLDHINGDNTDNKLENLRLLCPNCHSQTETYCGAKAKKEKHAYKYVCKTCSGPKKNSKSETCVKCRSKLQPTKIEWPTTDIVLQMTKDIGFSETGRKLGVSDNAVRKFLNRKPCNKIIYQL